VIAESEKRLAEEHLTYRLHAGTLYAGTPAKYFGKVEDQY
jgi:hypothetical protein